MKRITLFFFALLVFYSVHAQNNSTTKILKPNASGGKDAMVWKATNLNYDDLNFEKDNRLLCHSWTNQGVQDNSRLLIAFDLTDIPTDAVISKATMTLFNNSNTGSFNGEHKEQSGTNESVLSRISETWSENAVTWNNQPAISTKGQIQISRMSGPHYDLVVTVTDMVKDMVQNPSSNFGFMLSLKTESPYKALVFASSDYSDSTKWPEIKIEYAFSGLEEKISQRNATLKIVPNPSIGETEIRLILEKPEAWNLKLFNEIGQQVLEETKIKQSSFKFDNAPFSKGIYHVFITTESGLRLSTKMVKI